MKNHLIQLVIIVAVFFSTVLLAAPGHYIVVTMDDSGKAQPVFYRAVDFLEERSASPAMLKSSGKGSGSYD